MPEGLDFGHKEWDFQKRKNHNPITNNSLPNDEWESSSTTAPKLKRAKSQSDWRSGESEEVGDSDDLQLVGRDIFDPAVIGLENGIVGQIGFDGHKEAAKEIQGLKPKRPYEASKDREANKDNVEEAATEEMKDEEKTRQEPLTMNGTRLCMQSVMMELKKAREDMLIWLKQEMHNIIYEGSGTGIRTSLGGQGRGETEFEEQQGSGNNGIGSAAVLGTGMDFGAQASGSDGTEFFTGQNNSPPAGGGGGGIGYNGQNGGDSNYEAQNGVGERDDMRLGRLNERSDGVSMRFAGQKSAGHADVGFGARGNNNGNGGMNFGGQNRGHGGVAMSLHNGSVQVMGFERQSGSGDGVLNFRNQNEVPDEMTFGAPQQANGAGGMNFASPTSRETGMVFGGQNVNNGNGIQDGGRGRGMVKNRNSPSIGKSNTSASSAGNHKVNSTHMSDEERTPDLIGMQNQNVQNPVALSMMWNNVVQNPRVLNQNMSDSAVNGFHYDTHTKLGNGAIGAYRGLVHNTTAYENNVGMMNSHVIQAGNPSIGMQLPMGMQNPSGNALHTSGLTSLMGMQGQVPMQNFSGMQNFLGLSMNGNMGPPPVEGGISRQVFPGLYLNDSTQHPASAKSNPLSAPSGLRSRTHKRGGTLLGVDMLELNS
eukprot:Gb_26450 [translate_table: standard]